MTLTHHNHPIRKLVIFPFLHLHGTQERDTDNDTGLEAVHVYYLILSSSDTAKSLDAQLIRLNLLRQWRMKVFGGKVAAQN